MDSTQVPICGCSAPRHLEGLPLCGACGRVIVPGSPTQRPPGVTLDRAEAEIAIARRVLGHTLSASGGPLLMLLVQAARAGADEERERCAKVATRKRDVAKIKGWSAIADVCDMLARQILSGE